MTAVKRASEIAEERCILRPIVVEDFAPFRELDFQELGFPIHCANYERGWIAMIYPCGGSVWTAPIFAEPARFLMKLTVGQSTGGGGGALGALLTGRSIL